MKVKVEFFCDVCIRAERPARWGVNKMPGILQTPFSNDVLIMLDFLLEFHWISLIEINLTISLYCVGQWRGALQETSHYPNQCWSSSLNPYTVNRHNLLRRAHAYVSINGICSILEYNISWFFFFQDMWLAVILLNSAHHKNDILFYKHRLVKRALRLTHGWLITFSLIFGI